MTPSLLPTPTAIDHARWEERPTGGALQLHAPYPAAASITLEMVFAHGRPFWFIHVLDVPFEIDAGIA